MNEYTKISFERKGTECKVHIEGDLFDVLNAYESFTREIVKNISQVLPKDLAEDLMNKSFELAFKTEEEIKKEAEASIKKKLKKIMAILADEEETEDEE